MNQRQKKHLRNSHEVSRTEIIFVFAKNARKRLTTKSKHFQFSN